MGGSKAGHLTEDRVGDGVFLYTLERGAVRAVFSNWGATLISLHVPDAQGKRANIVLGFDTLGPYMSLSGTHSKSDRSRHVLCGRKVLHFAHQQWIQFPSWWCHWV